VKPEAGDVLAVGRQALQRGAWEEARAAFEAAADSHLAPEAYEGLGSAALAQADLAAGFAAHEEAYRRFRERGDARDAGRVAAQLAWNYFNLRGEPAIANGWTRRAHRLLDALEPCVEQGRLALAEGDALLFEAQDPIGARQRAQHMQELGRLLGVADLEILGLALEGLALVSAGEVAAGMSALDEAAAAAFGGELNDAGAAGVTFCYVIFGCEKARDYDRAGQWCERLRDLCERSGMGALLGVCRAHYAGVLTWSGEWQRAEAELTVADELLARLAPGLASESSLRLAELRRRQGRLSEAEALFEALEFHPLGLLGRAAVALDGEDPKAACEFADRALAALPEPNRAERAGAWELLVRARVALGDTDGAELALRKLRAIAASVTADPLRAAVNLGEGLLSRARGREDAARRQLERAVELYHRCGAPYETACARIELATSLQALDRLDEAAAHHARARATFERLGAAGPLARAAGAAANPSGLTRREREVLELIAEGLTNRAIAQRLMLSEHTVHRHVANLLNRLGVSTRAAAVAHAARRQRD
jgi:LuxR family transcriptional regulator, maltose regulon positive regulatory protein